MAFMDHKIYYCHSLQSPAQPCVAWWGVGAAGPGPSCSVLLAQPGLKGLPGGSCGCGDTMGGDNIRKPPRVWEGARPIALGVKEFLQDAGCDLEV